MSRTSTLVVILVAILAVTYAISFFAATSFSGNTWLVWPLRAAQFLLRLAGTQFALLWWDTGSTLGYLGSLLQALLRVALRGAILGGVLYFCIPSTPSTRWAASILVSSVALAAYPVRLAVDTARAHGMLAWLGRGPERREKEQATQKQLIEAAYRAGYARAHEEHQYAYFKEEERDDGRRQAGDNNKKKHKKRGRH